jgi:hypothetical protein
MLYSLYPPVSAASCWPTPGDEEAEAASPNDCITPAPVSTKPISKEEPANNLADRLNFDLCL